MGARDTITSTTETSRRGKIPNFTVPNKATTKRRIHRPSMNRKESLATQRLSSNLWPISENS
jgi:hypothetical protein